MPMKYFSYRTIRFWMDSSSSVSSSAYFSCGSCWVPLGAATGRILSRSHRHRRRHGPPALRHPDGDAGGENPDADQLAGGEVPPCVPRPPAEEVEHPAALLVAAEPFDQGAKRRVEHQVEREHLAVEAFAAAPVGEEKEDERAPERLVELGRVDGDGGRGAGGHQVRAHLRLVRERFGRKARGKEVVGVAGRAPAAARGEAAEPAQ